MDIARGFKPYQTTSTHARRYRCQQCGTDALVPISKVWDRFLTGAPLNCGSSCGSALAPVTLADVYPWDLARFGQIPWWLGFYGSLDDATSWIEASEFAAWTATSKQPFDKQQLAGWLVANAEDFNTAEAAVWEFLRSNGQDPFAYPFSLIAKARLADRAAIARPMPAAPSAWSARSSAPREPGSEAADPVELRQKAVAEVRRWIEAANVEAPRRWGTLVPFPGVTFDLCGHKAGESVSAGAGDPPVVRINDDLLQRYPTETFDNTIPHECAHIVADHVWGTETQPHGAEWRSVMDLFGKPHHRTHQMVTVASRTEARYSYACDCNGKIHQVGGAMHRNMETHTRHYKCVACEAVLRPSRNPERVGQTEWDH